MKLIIVSIDGPAASGKGAIARYIKKQFNFYHIDSGLLYRKVAKVIFDKKIKINNKQVTKVLKRIKNISKLSNKNVRTSNISRIASEIAKKQEVRHFINLYQKRLIKKNIKKYNGFVIDGRDIGTVVFKDANIKLYIDTNPKIRAKRRHKELIDMGEKSIYSNVLKEIKLRDKIDKNRKLSPLVIPKDAVIINNSSSFPKTKNLIKKIILKELNSYL